MFRSYSLPLMLLVLLGAVGLTIGGCDPQLRAGDGLDDLGGTGDDGGNAITTVSDEAAATGAVLALHMDIMRAGLSLAADFDTLTVSPLPGPRTIFQTDCLTLAEIDPAEPSFDLSLGGCVDGRGTTYRGGGSFESDGTYDGYSFFPYGDAAEMIIAENSENLIFNHTYKQGTLWFTYDREAGTGQVQGVSVANYIRHILLTQTATFSHDQLMFTGAPGNISEWPTAGAVTHVSWEGVGLYDITYTGGTSATFNLGGVDYVIQLTTGGVTLAPNQ